MGHGRRSADVREIERHLDAPRGLHAAKHAQRLAALVLRLRPEAEGTCGAHGQSPAVPVEVAKVEAARVVVQRVDRLEHVVFLEEGLLGLGNVVPVDHVRAALGASAGDLRDGVLKPVE